MQPWDGIVRNLDSTLGDGSVQPEPAVDVKILIQFVGLFIQKLAFVRIQVGYQLWELFD